MPRGRPRKSDEVLMKSAEFIGWALGGLEREIAHTRERLTSLTEQAKRLRQKVGASAIGASESQGSASDTGGTRRRRRGRMSPEARKRMSDMMKKRWAERRRK